MSIEQYQRTVNNLDREIADLEKKKATKEKEYATLQGRINTTNKSITKNTSITTLNSKMRQISGWESNAAKKSKESADLAVRIADKRKKRSEAFQKLQRAEQEEQKKVNKQNERVINSYERRIDELQRQLVQQIVSPQIISSQIKEEKDEEYDLFVSHAFEDKEDIVNELVAEFRKLNLKVWYDTNKLKIGDSMREKIDRGLSKSRYGVVVLSPNYIAENKYWTKSELNGLFQRETVNGKTILPIWHNLTKKQVTEYSPIIADRMALTTAQYTAEEIAREINELFFKTETEGKINEQA